MAGHDGRQILEKYIGALASLASLGVKGAHDLELFYRKLLYLMDALPFRDNQEFGVGKIYDPLIASLVSASQGIFVLRRSRAEMVDNLKAFIRLLGSSEAEKLPEAMILKSIADRWLTYLLDLPSLTELTVFAGVSLDLTSVEERFDGVEGVSGQICAVEVNLEIINKGIMEARDVWLYVDLKSKGESLKIDGLERVDDDHFRKFLCPSIKGGEYLLEILRVEVASDVRLNIGVEYEPQGVKGRRSSGNVLRIGAREFNDNGSENSPANPFVPDAPLVSESHWSDLVKGAHERMVDELICDSDLWAGRILVVWGCRRCGKTTLLRKIYTEMNSGEKYIAVYIDLYAWMVELSSGASETEVGHDALDVNDLYYEFAVKILSDTKIAIGLDDEEKESPKQVLFVERVLDEAEEMSLTLEKFVDIIKQVEQLTGRRVCFLIDELDWWVRKSDPKESADTILGLLTSLSKREKLFSAILSHDWTSRDWGPRSEDGFLALLPRRVSFLERGDVVNLATSSDVFCFSDLAIEYLWRVSGGWPGLLQYICYETVNAAASSGNSHRMVDVALVKRIVAELLQSRQRFSFIAYLLGSLGKDEREFLSWLVKKSLVDPRDGSLRAVGYEPEGRNVNPVEALSLNGKVPFSHDIASVILKSLEEKQIISMGGGGIARMRVGLLSYAATFRALALEEER